jgi:hypothetical protein
MPSCNLKARDCCYIFYLTLQQQLTTTASEASLCPPPPRQVDIYIYIHLAWGVGSLTYLILLSIYKALIDTVWSARAWAGGSPRSRTGRWWRPPAHLGVRQRLEGPDSAQRSSSGAESRAGARKRHLTALAALRRPPHSS